MDKEENGEYSSKNKQNDDSRAVPGVDSASEVDWDNGKDDHSDGEEASYVVEFAEASVVRHSGARIERRKEEDVDWCEKTTDNEVEVEGKSPMDRGLGKGSSNNGTDTCSGAENETTVQKLDIDIARKE